MTRPRRASLIEFFSISRRARGIKQTDALTVNEMRIGDTRWRIHPRGLARTLKGQARLFFHVGFTNGTTDVGHANGKHVLRNSHVRNHTSIHFNTLTTRVSTSRWKHQKNVLLCHVPVRRACLMDTVSILIVKVVRTAASQISHLWNARFLHIHRVYRVSLLFSQVWVIIPFDDVQRYGKYFYNDAIKYLEKYNLF